MGSFVYSSDRQVLTRRSVVSGVLFILCLKHGTPSQPSQTHGPGSVSSAVPGLL